MVTVFVRILLFHVLYYFCILLLLLYDRLVELIDCVGFLNDDLLVTVVCLHGLIGVIAFFVSRIQSENMRIIYVSN